jgi:hypothetical protein
MNDELGWLQQWFADHCDGDWEHDDGIKIQTLDNPGWEVSISVADTELEGISPEKVNLDRSDTDWIVYEVQNACFIARGGPNNLLEILRAFRQLVEGSDE